MKKDPRKILEIISEETRFEILKILSSKGRYLTVAEISEMLLKDKKTIDKHLRIMLEYNLLERKYLETEKAYGYYITSFASYLLNSILRAFETNIVSPSQYFEGKEEIKLKKKRFLNSYQLLGIFLIFIGFFISFGSRINLIPTGNEVAKFISLILFTLLGLYFIIQKRDGK